LICKGFNAICRETSRGIENTEVEESVLVLDLVNKFNVSEMTVRRNLDVLFKKGLLLQIHGGAMRNIGWGFEPPFLTCSNFNQEEKTNIEEISAELITYGDSVYLDVGTTTLEIEHDIAVKQNLTIIPTCFAIANLICENPNIHLIFSGVIFA
jgi:DeoR/GlpR family transcriptional regulator of sugar metabolism